MLSLVLHPDLCGASKVLVILGNPVLLRWVTGKNYVLYKSADRFVTALVRNIFKPGV